MRIAFLTFNAYDILTKDTKESVGGAQVQQVHIAQELAKRGHDPVFIENDTPSKTEEVHSGVRVVTNPVRENGHALVRAPIRVLDLLSTLARVDPDVCYARILSFNVLPVALYCALTGTRFIYAFAHDSELTDSPVVLENAFTSHPLYQGLLNRALGQADTLVVQNDFQYDRARNRFNNPIELIPNGYPSTTVEGNAIDERDSPVVLWVSTLRRWKRPELVLEIADECPNTTFIIVGPPADEAPEVANQIEREVSNRSNVIYDGFVPYSEVDHYFASADLFLNTSTEEGFPNTFLQAWAQGTPVASLDVNPNNILDNNEVGYCADGSLEDLIEFIQVTLSKNGDLTRMSETARTFFENEHSIESITDQYETVLSGRNYE